MKGGKMQTKINKLVLQGFKSFNRKTTIIFKNGLNIITGPNGSGKSNIIDALSFVLGRISAKSLRADRLIELIFHGSEKKKPAKEASVSIYLDNSSKIFPFKENEIVITRKINKKGVSIYKLNGKTTTRDKILQVLSTVRIYPNGHNIVFQGDITQIIEMNPIERRYLIDEICGIAEYNEKKGKALRDLEVVEQKLREAEILLNEKLSVYKKLEAERNAVLKYKELNEKLKILKGSYLNKKVELLEKEKERIEERIEKKKELLRKIDEKIEEIEKKLEEKENELRKVANQIFEFSKRLKIDKEITQLKTEILVNKSKLEAYQNELEKLDSIIERLQAIEERKREVLQELPRAVKEILSLDLKGVYGTISTNVKVDEKYRTAIEIAAANHWHDLIVENEEVAKFCIDFLKENKIGRATFLPLNKLKPKIFSDYSILRKEGVIDVASNLVKCNPKVRRAIDFIFGNTLIVKDFEAAKNVGIGKVRMVSLDGDLFERSGVIVGGFIPKPLEALKETKELEKYLDYRKSLKERIDYLKREIEDLEKKLKKLSQKQETQTILTLEKVKVVSQTELERLRDKRRSLIQRKIEVQSSLNTLEIERARIEGEIKNLKIELEEYKGLNFLDERLEEISRLMKKIEKEIIGLGPVNFRAVEEFDKFRVEFEAYKEKYEKVLEEKKAILKMIEEIEEKRREVFMKTLNEISDNFNYIFNKMTGGEAALELEEEGNIDSGLLIKANPKGKTLISIDALSGGEKTLTALAFILALQKYRPAPFYAFDEVDAALDKENTKKVAELLKEFSKKSQFILISHNEQMVKYGNVLYGVTMEDGESKIVALEMPGE